MELYPSLARKTLEYFFATGKKPDNAAALGLTDALLAQPASGAFVSLHTGKGGGLRGCIGTIIGTKSTLGDEIISNAMHAAFQDPRFPPLSQDELAGLHISVDVLGKAEPCEAADLNPKIYGVIVSCGWRRGLLLPDLEGVDNAETQIDIARRKGGIRENEPYTLERFRVHRYEE
jgi:AmmeMemoRadiSam system protein A